MLAYLVTQRTREIGNSRRARQHRRRGISFGLARGSASSWRSDSRGGRRRVVLAAAKRSYSLLFGRDARRIRFVLMLVSVLLAAVALAADVRSRARARRRSIQ
jgi:hypothetical protein